VLQLLEEVLELWRGPSIAEFASEPWARDDAHRLDDVRARCLEQRSSVLVEVGRADEALALLESSVHLFRDKAHFAEIVAAARAAGRSSVLHPRAFLFTDIVGSTSKWERHRDAMAESLRLHDRILRACIAEHGGEIFSNPGDGFGAAFERDVDAVAAAMAAQDGLASADWGRGPSLEVRMGVEVGEAERRSGNYFGPVVNQAARISDAGNGGQIVLGPNVRVAPGVATRTLGEHLLKGVPGPVLLAQVGDRDFGNLRAVERKRTNLVDTPDELLGRNTELRGVAALVHEHRLVTVTGVGGVGKTRLTQAVGADAVPKFSDGVWFVELAPCRDERTVLSAVAHALGVPVPDTAKRLGELVRGHELLLVLDNCEHVLDCVTELVEQLLAGTSRLRILASSRESLAVVGERVFPLSPLHDLDDAMEMFRRRAVAAGANIESLDPRVLAELCERLDRLPLAIELAGATSRVLPPEQMLGRLDQRFTILRKKSGQAGARHETLRNAIDWSYESLDDQQRTFLRRVAFFNGGISVDGAEFVAADLDRPALFLLGELMDRSLISVVERTPEARYGLLETIRLYVRDRVEELGEADEAIDRQVSWCESHLSSTAAAAFGDGEAAAITAMVAETDNYRTAVTRLLRLGDHVRAERLILGVEDFAYAANPLAELVEPLVVGASPDDLDGRRLLGIELIRRSISEGTEGRASLANQLLGSLRSEDPATLHIPVLLIASALQQDVPGIAAKVVERARRLDDGPERARLLVAALLGLFYSAEPPTSHDLVDETIRAVERAGMKRLMIAIGASVCMGGLATGAVAPAVRTARPILDLFDDLPTPSLMASGLIVSYTEAAVQADAAPADRLAAVRRLGPVLQGDFNRLGLALARLVQHEGEHRLAVLAVGASAREGRSRFSAAQIDAIVSTARDALGEAQVEELIDEGQRRERSEIYRAMWNQLQPGIEASVRSGSERSDVSLTGS
jgi:predicted ATPase